MSMPAAARILVNRPAHRYPRGAIDRPRRMADRPGRDCHREQKRNGPCLAKLCLAGLSLAALSLAALGDFESPPAFSAR